MHEKIKSDLHSENLHLETFWQDKNNRDSVIISTILGHKNKRAEEFETIFKSIKVVPETKAKIKEDFKARMTAEFEENRDYYTEQAIALAKNIEGLFYIFDQFKNNEDGNVVIGGVEKEELKRNIKIANEDILGQVQRGELVNPDLEQISFALSLYNLPNKYKIADQLAKIIKKNLVSETKKEATSAPILEGNRPKLFDRLKGFFLRRW
jgi:hypothetical protein